MYIKHLDLVEVKEIPQIARKTYNLNVGAESLSTLTQAITDAGDRITPNVVNQVVDNLVTFNRESEPVYIENGWNERRFRYTMEVELDAVGRLDSGCRLVVVGYTDRHDITHHDTVAPDLRFYIDHIIALRDTPRLDRRGVPYIETTVISNYQVLLGRYNDPINDLGGCDFIMRPRDVFSNIDTRRDVHSGLISSNIVPLGNTFAGGAQASNYSNNRRGRYLATMLNNDRASTISFNNDNTANEIGVSRNLNASDYSKEPVFGRSPFIRALFDHNDEYTSSASNWFEYRDLAKLTPERTLRDLDSLTEIFHTKGHAGLSDCDTLLGADPATMAMAAIIQEVPAIMQECVLAACEFTISNDRLGPDGEPQFFIEQQSIKTAVPGALDDGTLLFRFESAIIRDVFNPISRHNRSNVFMSINADVESFIIVSITVDGYRSRFGFPSFCSSLVPPVITNSVDTLNTTTDRYMELQDRIVNPLVSGNERYVEVRDPITPQRRTAGVESPTASSSNSTTYKDLF